MPRPYRLQCWWLASVVHAWHIPLHCLQVFVCGLRSPRREINWSSKNGSFLHRPQVFICTDWCCRQFPACTWSRQVPPLHRMASSWRSIGVVNACLLDVPTPQGWHMHSPTFWNHECIQAGDKTWAREDGAVSIRKGALAVWYPRVLCLEACAPVYNHCGSGKQASKAGGSPKLVIWSCAVGGSMIQCIGRGAQIMWVHLVGAPVEFKTWKPRVGGMPWTRPSMKESIDAQSVMFEVHVTCCMYIIVMLTKSKTTITNAWAIQRMLNPCSLINM